MVWAGALAGIAFRVLLGRRAALALHARLHRARLGRGVLPEGHPRQRRVAVVTLLAVGGLLYSVGGVVYALKRPNPSPRWFGFHEVFHALTLARVRRALHRRVDRDLPLLGLTRPGRARPARAGPWARTGRPAPSPRAARRATPRRACRPAARTRPAPPTATARRRPRPGCRAPAARAGAAGSSPAPTRCVNSSRGVAAVDAPRHLAAEAVLGLAGDRDPAVPGVLAEAP